jgi:uncharacterized protein Yka (UPF0111/DUF47 family)
MLKRFMPRETNFFDYFERHAAATVRGCRELVELTVAGTDFVARAARIKDIEHEADSITHDCVEALHKTFITPIDRDQIHMLISHMDDIMDYVEVVSDLCVLYNIDGMTQDARDLAAVLLDATLHIEGAVKGLRDMKHADTISEACIEVNRLENAGDELLEAVAAFRRGEGPVAIIKRKNHENLEMRRTAIRREHHRGYRLENARCRRQAPHVDLVWIIVILTVVVAFARRHQWVARRRELIATIVRPRSGRATSSAAFFNFTDIYLRSPRRHTVSRSSLQAETRPTFAVLA